MLEQRHAETRPAAPSAGLFDAMGELARTPPRRPSPGRREYDGAAHVMLGVLAGKITGGLTRYPYPPPRFELAGGVAIDRTYETDAARAARAATATNPGGPK